MPTPDKKYWIGRFTQMEQAQHKAAVEVADDIERQFKTAQHEVERQLSTWYQRYAVNNQVSMKEARRQLNTKELKEFRWTVNEYIKYGKENGISADWSKQLENASARFHVTRLQAIQLELQNTVEVLYGGQTDALDALMKKTYLDSYYHTAFEIQRGVGVAWDIAAVNQKALVTIINTPWTVDGRNFSERIWANKQALIGELRTQLTQNLMLGKSPAESVKIIAAKMGVAEHKAARLVFTESAYFQAVSQGNCYKALDVRKFQFIATLDDRTSDVCREMDGQVFDMRDYQPGVNVPPLHPWCRSCTAPYYEDLAGIGERAARDPETGQTYYVPRETKYEDWKQSFVDGGSKQGLTPVANTAIMGIAGCKTVADVENLMKNQGWFNVQTINGTVCDTNQTLSLHGCDLDVAKGVYEACDELFTKFPQLKGKLNSISTAPLSGNTYANCMVGLGHGGVTVNQKYFSDIAKLTRTYDRDLASGFHPLGTDWRGIVTHEMGHAIDDYLTNTLHLAGVQRSGWSYKYVSADMRPKVMRACGLKVSDTFKEVSGYATKDHFEWFAECFAEFVQSPTPRRVATKFGEMLTELLKGVQ